MRQPVLPRRATAFLCRQPRVQTPLAMKHLLLPSTLPPGACCGGRTQEPAWRSQGAYRRLCARQRRLWQHQPAAGRGGRCSVCVVRALGCGVTAGLAVAQDDCLTAGWLRGCGRAHHRTTCTLAAAPLHTGPASHLHSSDHPRRETRLPAPRRSSLFAWHASIPGRWWCLRWQR